MLFTIQRSEEMVVVREALESLRSLFRPHDPHHHTLDTLEQVSNSKTTTTTKKTKKWWAHLCGFGAITSPSMLYSNVAYYYKIKLKTETILTTLALQLRSIFCLAVNNFASYLRFWGSIVWALIVMTGCWSLLFCRRFAR